MVDWWPMDGHAPGDGDLGAAEAENRSRTMAEITVKVHDVTTDGLPDMDDDVMTGRVAFIWDGAVISGWPQSGLTYDDPLRALWNGAEDRFHGPYAGVRYWLELPVPAWSIGKGQGERSAGVCTPSQPCAHCVERLAERTERTDG